MRPEARTRGSSLGATRRPLWPPSPADTVRLALAALLVGVVVWATPRTIQPGDAGEFATIMLRGGVPHPSGYPWMRALGLLARPLEAFGIPPAVAAALVCGSCGAAAWLLLHPLLCRLGGLPAATFVVVLLATSSTVLVHTYDAEVWGPHLLACTIVLRLTLSRRRVHPYWIGLSLGLAASHHLTAVLLIPLAVGAAWPAASGASRAPRWTAALFRNGIAGLAGSATGLLFFGTLMVGDGGAWRWGDTQSWAGLLHHVTRADYGVAQLSLHQDHVSVLTQWARTAASLGAIITANPDPGALAGLAMLGLVAAVCWRAGRGGLRRSVAWGLAGSIAASAVVFPAMHNINPAGPFGAWILERFDLLSTLLLALPLTIAWGTAARWARDRARRIGLALVCVSLCGAQLWNTAVAGVPAEDRLVQHYAAALLQTPAPGGRSLVFGTDDHRTFPVLYVQRVLGVRPDVVYVDASLLTHAWYRADLRARFPGLPDVDKPLRLMAAIWRTPTLANTPIYLANDFSAPSTRLSRVPEGILWRVIPPPALASEPPPEVPRIVRRHRAALARIRASDDGPRSLAPRRAHPFTADLLAHYNAPATRLAAALAEAEAAPSAPPRPR